MEEKEKKLSYEELEQQYEAAKENVRKAYMAGRSDATGVLQRLGFLFKVLENYAHFDPDFVTACASEIQDMLSIGEEETQENNDSRD